MGEYRLVTVGTDGSDSAARAVSRAARVCADSGARLLIVCAYEDRGSTTRPRDVGEAERALGDEAYKILGSTPAEETLRDARDAAVAAGAGRVDTVAVEGDPAEAIIGKSRLYKADLVVVGNKGLASFANRLLGSVPQQVSRRAKVDVLVVHTV